MSCQYLFWAFAGAVLRLCCSVRAGFVHLILLRSTACRVGVNRYNFLLESMTDLDARCVCIRACNTFMPAHALTAAAPALS